MFSLYFYLVCLRFRACPSVVQIHIMFALGWWREVKLVQREVDGASACACLLRLTRICPQFEILPSRLPYAVPLAKVCSSLSFYHR